LDRIFIRADPQNQLLRDDDRFRSIVERMNFPCHTSPADLA
jgi:hypothetical protein